MPDSMTGFGRAESNALAGKLVAEIQSVNRKYLEVFISLPKEYGRFENEIRKWVTRKIGRGQIHVRLHLIPNLKSYEMLLPDASVLENLKTGWEALAKKIGYESPVIDFSFLIENMPIQNGVQFADEKDLIPLEVCIEEALESLKQMKKKEGMSLAKDLLERLNGLELKAAEIKMLSPETTRRLREKLKERMLEVLELPLDKEIEERLFREVAFFAEKIDVTEELIRLDSHFSQFRELLNPKTEAVGRKMEFLIQEMGREINTIGSKSADAKVSHLIVDMKSDLEKIREQIQNIE